MRDTELAVLDSLKPFSRLDDANWEILVKSVEMAGGLDSALPKTVLQEIVFAKSQMLKIGNGNNQYTNRGGAGGGAAKKPAGGAGGAGAGSADSPSSTGDAKKDKQLDQLAQEADLAGATAGKTGQDAHNAAAQEMWNTAYGNESYDSLWSSVSDDADFYKLTSIAANRAGIKGSTKALMSAVENGDI